jgi:hypothetical protein
LDGLADLDGTPMGEPSHVEALPYRPRRRQPSAAYTMLDMIDLKTVVLDVGD